MTDNQTTPVAARLRAHDDSNSIDLELLDKAANEIERLSKLLDEALTGWRIKCDECYRLRSGIERLLKETA